MATDIHPFEVDIPPAEVERLQRKLNDTRIPDREIIRGAGEKYEDINLHFVHARANEKFHANAIPLLLIHGWPGSFYEFSRVWYPLSHPESEIDPAFHVVVPHTIGFALHDNPLGMLMWVGEKYNEAAHPSNQEAASWREAILATCSLYYFTGCIMPSMLC
ncbi:Alpha/Beta hydrolase protein [Aspergillus undulatus]|uniref:Alpha/Beta hydrolase protein n=1 Tax=Aspergillus undulatus TaxID=1810928 RepID=UPI003CCDE29D